MSGPILPGATLGVLGSGQLGRMFALAAQRMGYRVAVLSPGTDTPTGQVANREVAAPYDDLDAVRAFAGSVEVVTFEFENVPTATATAAAEMGPVRPAGEILHATQHRRREKEALVAARVPVVEHRMIESADDLPEAMEAVGAPAILKTAAFGYDGKGQARIDHAGQVEAAWRELGAGACVLEAVVDFEREISVVGARGLDGSVALYTPSDNHHVNHILDVSVAPADLPPGVAERAREIARTLLEAWEVVGVICVEMFQLPGGGLIVNEVAPRPHNSGHLTIEGCATSQFEQQVRAACGVPLGSTDLVAPAAMANLLGDLWNDGPPDWGRALAVPGVALHLYGKAEARPGRKMGHLTALAETPEKARDRVLRARDALADGLRPATAAPARERR